jgi:hypothetical protein
MTHRLSSRLTFYYRFLLPALWIPGFGLAALAVWIGRTNAGEPIPTEIKLVVLAAWIVGSLVILRLALGVKTVYLERDRLIVSDAGNDMRIPLTEVEDIVESRFWNPKLIKVTLRHTLAYPRQIVFLAPVRFQFVWSEHPIVRELRTQVASAKRERTGTMR